MGTIVTLQGDFKQIIKEGEIGNLSSTKKLITYSEIETLTEFYLNSLLKDIKEDLEQHSSPSTLDLVTSYIDNHFSNLKYSLLRFFVNHE